MFQKEFFSKFFCDTNKKTQKTNFSFLSLKDILFIFPFFEAALLNGNMFDYFRTYFELENAGKW